MGDNRQPLLGYGSKTDAIWALIGQGRTLEEVASETDIPRANVKCFLGYKRGRWFPKRPGRYLVDSAGHLHPCQSKSIEAVAAVTVRPTNRNEIGQTAETARPQREEDTAPAVTAPAPSPATPRTNEGTAGETAPESEPSFGRLPVEQSGGTRMAERGGVSPSPRVPEAPPPPKIVATVCQARGLDPADRLELIRAAAQKLAAKGATERPSRTLDRRTRAKTTPKPEPMPQAAEPAPSFVRDGVPVQRRCSGCGSWTASPCARRWCPLRPVELANG